MAAAGVRGTSFAAPLRGLLHFGPSHNLLRPTIVELVSCGPRFSWCRGWHRSATPEASLRFLNALARLSFSHCLSGCASSRRVCPVSILIDRPHFCLGKVNTICFSLVLFVHLYVCSYSLISNLFQRCIEGCGVQTDIPKAFSLIPTCSNRQNSI